MGNKPRIGFIGIGQMGKPMAGRLVDAGYPVIIYDLSENCVNEFLKKFNAEKAHTISTLGEKSEIVITMLPDGNAVKSIAIANENGNRLLGAMAEGSVLIDMSSSLPKTTKIIGEEIEKYGIAMLDAPVSGGVKGATNGTLAIMVGGSPTTVERCRPILQTMGNRIFETGSLGSGHAMKVLNNLLNAVGLIAASEAIVIGSKLGLDAELMIDVINASTGRNNSTENKVKQYILSRKFNSGFSLDLLLKDVSIAMDLASDNEVPAPMGKVCNEILAAAKASLISPTDHTEIIRWYEKSVKLHEGS